MNSQIDRNKIDYLLSHCCHRIDFEDENLIILYDNNLTELNGYPHPYHYFLKNKDGFLNLGRHRFNHFSCKFKTEQQTTLGSIREENKFPRYEFLWSYSNKILVHDKQIGIYIAYLNIDTEGFQTDRCFFLCLGSDIDSVKTEARKYWCPDSPNFSRSIEEIACDVIETMISSRLKKNSEILESDWSFVYYTKENKFVSYRPSKNILTQNHRKKGCESCQYCDFLNR